MSWSSHQTKRLAEEKQLLEKYFGKRITWFDQNSSSNAKMEVVLNTNNGNIYTLRISIPNDYPNGLPIMVVYKSPAPMPDWISGPKTHTFGKNEDGHLVICYFRRDRWNAQRNLLDVLLKGRIWLEAYEGHLATGQDMDYFLAPMLGKNDIELNRSKSH